MKLAEWTTAFVNTLPDSAFLYVAPGGEKDEEGKTVPRSLRYFPYRDASGEVDLPHLRNAIARIPQSTAPGLTKEKMSQLQDKARAILEEERDEVATDEVQGYPEDEEKKPDMQPQAAMSEWCQLVRLADEGPQASITSWVEMVRSGAHFGRDSERSIKITEDDISSMERGYRIIQSERWFAQGPPVGYNHAGFSGALDPDSTRAAGRILDVQVRANDEGGLSLYGLVQWTNDARKRVRAGEFDGFSIEVVMPDGSRSKKTGEPLGEWALIGGTLTNEPFVPGMERVAASEKRKSRMGLTKLLSDALAMDEGNDAQIIARVQELAEQASKVEALSEALESVTADRDSIKAKYEDLESREIERTLDQACVDGRICATERDRYLRAIRALGEEEANYAYPKGRIPTEEVGEAGEESVRGTAPSLEDEVSALAEKIASENNMTAASAYAQAMSMVLADPNKLAAYESAATN